MKNNDVAEIERLEHQLRASGWMLHSSAALNGDDAAIAAKLLGGTDQVTRFNRLKSGQRFRHTPLRTTKIEYFFVPPDERHHGLMSGWRFEVFENHKRRDRPFAVGLNDQQCVRVLDAFAKCGFQPRLLITEGMKARGIYAVSRPRPETMPDERPRQRRPLSASRQQVSQRRAILRKLGGFKL